MTAADHLQHLAGVASLVTIAAAGVASIWTIVSTVAPQAHRIAEGMRGRPVPPAASDAPHASAFPQLRAVEAGAQPTFRVIR
jgi:hypothetical protein